MISRSASPRSKTTSRALTFLPCRVSLGLYHVAIHELMVLTPFQNSELAPSSQAVFLSMWCGDIFAWDSGCREVQQIKHHRCIQFHVPAKCTFLVRHDQNCYLSFRLHIIRRGQVCKMITEPDLLSLLSSNGWARLDVHGDDGSVTEFTMTSCICDRLHRGTNFISRECANG